MVALLLNLSAGYTRHLAKNEGVEPLVEILLHKTLMVVGKQMGGSADDKATVMFILLSLLWLVQSSDSVLRIVKKGVFLPKAKSAFSLQAAVKVSKGNTEGAARAKNMAPLDALCGMLW